MHESLWKRACGIFVRRKVFPVINNTEIVDRISLWQRFGDDA